MKLLLALLGAVLVVSGCGAQPGAPAEQTVLVKALQLDNGADRPLPTLIYEPSGGGKLPLILFVHGYTRRPEDHDLLFKHWAKAGFVVAAPTMSRTARGSNPLDIEDLINQPKDASAVLTKVLEQLKDRVDAGKVVAAGHSLGGMTTVGMFTKFRDDRLKGGIVLAGAPRAVGTGYTGAPANMLFIHGRQDRVVPIEQGREAYDPCPWPKAFLDLKYADHLGPYLATSDEYQTVAAVTTDFLLWTVHHDDAAKRRLAATEGLLLQGAD